MNHTLLEESRVFPMVVACHPCITFVSWIKVYSEVKYEVMVVENP